MTKYTKADGFCGVCHKPYWEKGHDHRKLGTLSPEAAAKAWQNKLARELEDAANAEAQNATEPGE